MNSTKNNTDYDIEIFGDQLAEQKTKNRRIAIRYVRNDITATLIQSNFFNVKKTTSVRLIDVSSKGAAIQCDTSLTLKKQVILELLFKDDQVFKIPAFIIHKTNEKNTDYGLKFVRFNNELGDYLLSSQNDLVFK
jgi:hypothetical protein